VWFMPCTCTGGGGTGVNFASNALHSCASTHRCEQPASGTSARTCMCGPARR
jgi:hypothetical protein